MTRSDDRYTDPDDYRVREQTDRRLEYLRGEIRAERISYGEISELQSLVDDIDPTDVELLQWAGVPEHPPTCDICDEPEDQDPTNGREYDWNGETGCHLSCERGMVLR